MTRRVLTFAETVATGLMPSRRLVVFALELAGLAGVCYGISGWSVSAAFVAAGAGLVLEAYAVERR